MFTTELLTTAESILNAARARGLTLTTAESCTGGLIAALLTEIAGSSDVFTHGYVTYANAAKTGMIGVDAGLITAHGAVSEAVAQAMAQGALRASGADVSVAVTGIAGPRGATAEKPVGLVHMASSRAGGDTLHQQHVFDGDRSAIRMQAVAAALTLLTQQLLR